jgi:hypothetical protein
MTCPDCKSVVLFGEHYHRPGCNFGQELQATEFDIGLRTRIAVEDEISEEERANFDPWELADRERDDR